MTHMSKEKFVYNTQTLRYEKVVVPMRKKVLRVLGFLCAGLVTAVCFTLLIWELVPSPKERALERELSGVTTLLKEFNSTLDQRSQVLENVHERDVYVHRVMFGMDPVDDNVWNGGIGGHDPYSNFDQYSVTGDLLRVTRSKMDRLSRKLKMQSVSLDTIQALAEDKKAMLESVPMIKPVRSDKLARRVRLLSGYGRRMHPVYKVMKMHAGIDFTAPQGTAIQATGAGKVTRVENRANGYGRNVIIDHGFGYETLYAHMHTVEVKKGDKVTRGQQIGTVGSTGTSTAPHCHYEVHYKGKKVNPIHYCMDGLSPEEYNELTEQARVANQSLD